MKEQKYLKLKLNKSQRLVKIGQHIYITCANFITNNLWESAAACSFGFIFSFVPLLLILIVILSSIINISPEIYSYLMDFLKEIETVIDLKYIFNDLLQQKTINVINIFLGFWVIWMARKLFLSILQAMSKIFRSVTKRKTIFNELVTFIFEFASVVLIAAIIILAFLFNQITQTEVFSFIKTYFPILFYQSSHNLITLVIYIMIFLITILVYRFAPGTDPKPKLHLCIFYAFLNTVVFYLFALIIDKSIDIQRYNIIYGAISNLILLMLRVYFFFIFFLFFSQMLYVSQFFDVLLQAEIYTLPSTEKNNIWNAFRRFMFINPAALRTESNTLYYPKGYELYKRGDPFEFVYYVRKGEITETIYEGEKETKVTVYKMGSFIGDVNCVLKQPYSANAVVSEKCKLITFTAQEFMDLIHSNSKAALKVISKISEDTAFFYSEDNEI